MNKKLLKKKIIKKNIKRLSKLVNLDNKAFATADSILKETPEVKK